MSEDNKTKDAVMARTMLRKRLSACASDELHVLSLMLEEFSQKRHMDRLTESEQNAILNLEDAFVDFRRSE